MVTMGSIWSRELHICNSLFFFRVQARARGNRQPSLRAVTHEKKAKRRYLERESRYRNGSVPLSLGNLLEKQTLLLTAGEERSLFFVISRLGFGR